MEQRPQLPPITTHFAEFFPKHKTHASLVTPPEDANFHDRPLKRKRSDPEPFRRTSPRRFEHDSVRSRPSTSAYRSPGTNQPEQKRIASFISREIPQRHEDPIPDQTRTAAPASPPRYSVSGDRLGKGDTTNTEPRKEQASYPRGEPVDWLSSVRETRVEEPRVLSPSSRPKSPAGRTADDRWKNPWRTGPPSFPAPIEPKASYYQMHAEDKADAILAAKNPASEPSRAPPYSSLPPTGSAAHNLTSEARPPGPTGRPYGRNSIHSPTETSPIARGPGMFQTTPPQRSARGSHGGQGGYSNSQSDSSPVSAPAPPRSPQRYTWDAPGLYEHSHRKRRGNLPKESTALLTEWFNKHSSYPYPKEAEKQALQMQTGLAMSQISNWFVNARRRRRPSVSTRVDHIHHQPSSSRDREPLHTARYQ